MKSFLKYCMVLCALVGFMASSFELNQEEFKHNFKKEDHTYIVSAKSVTANDFHIDHPLPLPVNPIRLVVEERFVQQSHTYNFFTDPDPPDKIYLRNSVFRI